MDALRLACAQDAVAVNGYLAAGVVEHDPESGGSDVVAGDPDAVGADVIDTGEVYAVELSGGSDDLVAGHAQAVEASPEQHHLPGVDREGCPAGDHGVAADRDVMGVNPAHDPSQQHVVGELNPLGRVSGKA